MDHEESATSALPAGATRGTLATITVELPYETAEEKARADEMNRELSKFGVRTSRIADDWGFRPFGGDRGSKPVRFESGDLVRVFSSVSEGSVRWEGVVDFDRTAYYHGLQKGMDRGEWAHMFFEELPARLEKDGKVLFGRLEPFCETGTEGIIWSLKEYGVPGYGGLHCLSDGDRLTVYSDVRNGNVAFEGTLHFGPDGPTKTGWTEVFRQTNHLPTQQWLEMTWDRMPAVIVPKGPSQG